MYSEKTYNKIKVLSILFIVAFLIFVFRLAQLQFIQGEKYRQWSEGNRIDYRTIPASRGRIYLRNGEGLTIAVSNKMAYAASVIPANLADYPLEETIGNIAAILALDEENLLAKIQESPRSAKIPIKRKLSGEELLALEESFSDIPGLIIEKTPIRDYVYGSLGAHFLGYVGEISRSELNTFFPLGYKAGDFLGKTGLERYYESSLQGQEGLRQIEVNNVGKEVGTLGIKPPVQGSDLYLSIDYTLQRDVERYLADQIRGLQLIAPDNEDLKGGPTGGSVIVMEPQTGRILAMASYPTYDLNLFAGGIDPVELRLLQDNPLQPFFDRTVQVAPPCGSIFKIIVGLAALEHIIEDPQEKFFACPGFFELGDYKWLCWRDDGHGKQSFYDALANSCNVSFYTMGYLLYQKGGELIQKTAREFGLGRLSGIDIPSEQVGLVPDIAWKKEFAREPWYAGDTINLSVGQGSLQVTPLQLVNMVSAIVNGGHLMQPYLLEKIISAEGEVLFENKPRILNEADISQQSLIDIRKAMEAVVDYGTGWGQLGNFPIKVAGKTGTAQTVTHLERANHGWFVGYAPADKPEIAFVVFLEHGNDSKYALPIAKGLLETYFDLKEVVD